MALSSEFPLLNKRILLAVTGSVAGCKAHEIIRELSEAGAEVQVLLTDSGRQFFTPETAGALTDLPVLLDQYEDTDPGEMPHIEVKRKTDLVLVAPATANRLYQLERPTADDTLSTILSAFSGPVLYAPAMNPDMWNQPELEVIARNHSEQIIQPAEGTMACGDTGPGRLPDSTIILERLIQTLWSKPLEGQSWVVSAGPTREPWDDVRYLTNQSSGRMGILLARVGDWLGADITLVTGARCKRHSPG
ncbi:MAG: flavoprotein, partial [bacterium]